MLYRHLQACCSYSYFLWPDGTLEGDVVSYHVRLPILAQLQKVPNSTAGWCITFGQTITIDLCMSSEHTNHQTTQVLMRNTAKNIPVLEVWIVIQDILQFLSNIISSNTVHTYKAAAGRSLTVCTERIHFQFVKLMNGEEKKRKTCDMIRSVDGMEKITIYNKNLWKKEVSVDNCSFI